MVVKPPKVRAHLKAAEPQAAGNRPAGSNRGNGRAGKAPAAGTAKAPAKAGKKKASKAAAKRADTARHRPTPPPRLKKKRRH